MKKISFVLFLVVAICLFPVFSIQAQPGPCGDANDDGATDQADVIYLIAYLFAGGPPPPFPQDADCDYYPGIDIGDMIQLNEYIFHGGPPPICCPGDLPTFPDISFNVSSVVASPPSSPPNPPAVVNLSMTIGLAAPDIKVMSIPLSYKSQTGEVQLSNPVVTFMYQPAGIIPPNWQCSANINGTDKTILLVLNNTCLNPAILAGSAGLIAQITFDYIWNPLPAVVNISPLIPPSNPFLLLTRCSYTAGDLPGRVAVPSIESFYPGRILGYHNGDVNCLDGVEFTDILYLIDYIFSGGPPPCGE